MPCCKCDADLTLAIGQSGKAEGEIYHVWAYYELHPVTGVSHEDCDASD